MQCLILKILRFFPYLNQNNAILEKYISPGLNILQVEIYSPDLSSAFMCDLYL